MAEPWARLGALEYRGSNGPRQLFGELGGAGRLIVTVVEPNVVRVQVQPHGEASVNKTWAVVGCAGDAPREGRDRDDLSVFSCPTPVVEESVGEIVLRTPNVTVRVSLDTASLSFELPDGQVLLRDHPELAYRYATAKGTTAEPRGIRHTLVRDLAEAYLGLGEVSGPLDKHHRRYRLRPTDALGYDAGSSDPLYKHLPVYSTLTRSGHAVGLLYDSGAEAVFDLGSEIDNYVGAFRYTELAARELDYYVLVGPELSKVVTLIQELTGFAPLPPRWAFGYLGSTMRYTDAEDPTAELEGFVASLRRFDIACSAFHLSSGYSLGEDGKRYVFHWNRRRVPDPSAMIRPLREAGIKTLANIKPGLLTSHPYYQELAAAGAFVRDSRGGGPYRARWWGGPGSYLDFTNAAGYDWWVGQVREQLLEKGIDATWNDNNEFQIPDDDALTAAGFAGDVRPVLTLLMNRASRDAQRLQRPADRDFQISRAGSLGTQRYAQTWSGDNQTSWRTLKYNLPMGLGLSLSGWSSYGHDVGGFAGPMPEPELLLRWIEAGIFQPRFCIHSWNDDQTATEPWTYPELLPAVRRLFALRQALVPYLYTLTHRSVRDGRPLTRPFAFEFQQWRDGWRESFAYMLGEALLVAPVLEAGAQARELLLPPGRWLELQTGKVLQGARKVSLRAPMGWPPLLLKAGSAVPLMLADALAVGAPALGPGRQAPGGPSAPDVRWLSFPDSAGRFTGQLVWDDGVSRPGSGAPVVEVRISGVTRPRGAVSFELESEGAAELLGGHTVLLPSRKRSGPGVFLPWFEGSRWLESD